MTTVKVKKLPAEDRAWIRGYNWAVKLGYSTNEKDDFSTQVRNCRLIAMAYAQGFVNGKKAEQKRTKYHDPCPDCGTTCNDHTKHCNY